MSGTLKSTFIPFFLKSNIKKYLSDWVRSYFSPLFSLGVVHGLQCVRDSIVVACRLSMWDPSSPTREQTHVHHIRRQVLNHWTTRKGSPSSFFINATNEEKELAPKSSSAPHGAETWLLGFLMFKRTHAALTDLIIHSYVQHTHSPKLWAYEGDWNGCNPCFPMISIFFFFVKSGWWNNVVGCGRHWEKWSCTDWKSMPCTCMGFPSGSDGKSLPAEWENWVWSLGWEDPWRRVWVPTPVFLGFPGDSDSKESACNVGDLDSIPGLGRSLDGGMATHSYSCLENPHGQRSMVGYWLWGRKESDTTEQISVCLHRYMRKTATA